MNATKRSIIADTASHRHHVLRPLCPVSCMLAPRASTQFLHRLKHRSRSVAQIGSSREEPAIGHCSASWPRSRSGREAISPTSAPVGPSIGPTGAPAVSDASTNTPRRPRHSNSIVSLPHPVPAHSIGQIPCARSSCRGSLTKAPGLLMAELLILLCELAALVDGFVEGLAAEHGGL